MRSWLKEIRVEKKLTQSAVAFKAGISQQAYSAIEKGTRDPSTLVAKRIARLLRFSWTKFFPDEPKETPPE